jgi:uncharacterized repeat protein (TIGR01451 family)
MKTLILLFTKFAVLFVLFSITLQVNAQRASNSIPIGVARTSCTGGSSTMAYYNYNEVTNILSNAGSPSSCIPALRIGGSGFTYTANLSSVSYNPKDTNIYYLYTNLAIPRTYIWKWPVGTCPSTSIDTIRSFNYDILGVSFDNDGTGYMLEFEGSASPYKSFLRSIDFTTGAIGQKDTLELTNGKILHRTGTGDIVISPNGLMYFACDNKLFSPRFKDYGQPERKITAQFIDTVITSTPTIDLVALTYAQGSLISNFTGSTTGCNYFEITPGLTYDAPINNTSTNRMVDGATVVSGLGVAKRLVSYSVVSSGVYDLGYEILIKNNGTIPIRNVQVFDTLSKINPSGVVSNVSTSFVTNPGSAFVLNSGYNGTSNTSLLTSSTTPLNNFPSNTNTIVIRVNCRITNLIPGIEYRNWAVATANGFNGIALRDSSTNGTNPDLNNNGVADNRGENRPTPFYINTLTIGGVCNSFANFVYNQDFGTGTGLTSTIPIEPSKSRRAFTNYTGTSTAPVGVDNFTVSNNAINGNSTEWVNLTDHTGNTNGRMLLVNADNSQNIFYRDTVELCGGHEYSIALWAAMLTNASQQAVCLALGGTRYPRIRLRIYDVNTNLRLADTVSPSFILNSWSQVGFRWVMPSNYSNIYFELINEGNGGCGNDIAIDDIQIGTCSPDPTISILAPANSCPGFAATFTANIANSSVIPGPKQYRLEVSNDGATDWNTVITTNQNSYTINPTLSTDLNKYYRFILADSASGNIDVTTCRFISNVAFLSGKNISIPADSAKQQKLLSCPGEPVRLRALGGDSGTNGTWQWYTGSCGGVLIGTGSSIVVTPLATTTYYVRATGDCNSSICMPITVTINCDIDDDNDGIPDLVENDGVDVELDDDFDNIPNFRDNATPGFVDTDSDGVDDRYDFDQDGIPNHLDRDSDNDGIPDVIESFGVDVNGDGIIDNYSDTDADGFSQNVDGNNLGWIGSGRGLDNLDFDQDGYPNFKDVDTDGDGIPDIREASGNDTNNDGIIDNSWSDSNNDGFHDTYAATPILITGTDTDANGRTNSYPNTGNLDNMDSDLRPNPYDLDSDGDGLTDVIEQMFARYVATSGIGTEIWDSNLDGRADGAVNNKGYTNTIAAFGSLTIYNSDADVRPNYLDIDSDNDGITDNIEGQTTFTTGADYLLPTGSDTDNDGILDIYEAVGDIGTTRGGRINPLNIDGDLMADFLDSDSDGDGTTDLKEGNDFNRNGNYTDDANNLQNSDTDFDGLDNRFDTLTGPNVTSRLLGDLGSTTGPLPGSYGTRARVWRIVAGNYDRDWRYRLGLLAITELTFEGSLANSTALLNWSFVKKAGMATIYLERSTNGVHFETIYTNLSNDLNIGTKYGGYNDNWNLLPLQTYYYRVKAVSADGEVKMSQIIVLKNPNKKGNQVQVFPNPIHEQFVVNINAVQKGKVMIDLIDAQGKIVELRTVNVEVGSNQVQFANLKKYQTGMYLLRVKYENELILTKLIKE